MRIKQGLKGFQLAERMQVSAARVSVLEKDEMRGAVTLKVMQKAAKAMGCRFQYQIVPIHESETVLDKGSVSTNTSIQSSSDAPRDDKPMYGKPRVRVIAK